ncbi:MAG: hypothetical protein EBQ98_00310 [Actinobacteria bacterium]|nr:hypothetical protein [Actinomycetota bacterium]
MATIEQLGKALINADAAGDVEAAKTLAAEIKRMRGPTFTPRAATPADIPGAVEQPTPAPDGRGILDYIVGGPEAAFTLATGAAAVPVSSAAGILTGKFGEGPNKAVQERVMRSFTHQPQTQTARDILGAVGNAVSGLPPYVGTMGAFRPAPAINALRNEAQMIREFQPFPERAARLQQERVTQSFQNAPQIEAAQAAQRLGVAIPPAVSNPTRSNKIIAALTGSPEARMARSNELQWTNAAKKDMGLTPATTLDKAAFDKARSAPEITQPYEAVGGIRQLMPDEQTLSVIEGLRTPALIGGEASARAVSGLIDSTVQKLNGGLSGSEALANIRNLRQSAQTVYNAQRKGITPPSPESIAVADASIAIANQLEELAAQQLTGTQARAFQNARTLLAKTYDYERATDFNTGRVDPTQLAAMAKQKPLTGTAADIASVAANFPSIAEVKPGAAPILPTLARGGTGGTLGFGLGSVVGFPALGGVIGASGGMLANALMARRMSTPAYQAAHAMPPDYRPPINALRPVEPGASNLAMFNPQSAVLPPEYTPNFTMPGQPQQPRSAYEAAQQALREQGLQRTGSLGPDLQPANVPPQLPMPGMEGPAQARGYEYARDRAAAEAAAAQGAGPRQPAAGGMIYELDPFTGKLRPVDQGVKGATPETFVNYGSALESAVGKVMRGERPTMTAEEMIAWKKTRVDLAAADPGYAKLSDKAITEKMMDRKWVGDTIQKARDQAKAFEEIAARAKDAQAKRDAIAKRDQLMDLLDTLEAQYARPRPTPSPQGPKTREAKRNALAPKSENQLAP